MPPNSNPKRKQKNPEISEENRENKDRINCVVVGDAHVGKTSMIVSYTSEGYPESYVPTVHDYYTVRLNVGQRPLTLQLVDTAGQQQFEMIRRLSYPDAEVFMLCFSVCDPDTFLSIRDKWMPELKEYQPKMPVILVGTQVDRRNDLDVLCRLARNGKKPISTTEGEHCAEKIGAKKYIECSALTQKNLKATFDSAIIIALESREKKLRKQSTARLSIRRFSSIRKSIRSNLDKRSSIHSGSSRSSTGSSIHSSITSESTYSKTFNPEDFDTPRNTLQYLLCLR